LSALRLDWAFEYLEKLKSQHPEIGLRAFEISRSTRNRDRLLDIICGRDYTPFDRAIDVHISRLRQKIEENAQHPQRILTVRGVGYKLNPDQF